MRKEGEEAGEATKGALLPFVILDFFKKKDLKQVWQNAKYLLYLGGESQVLVVLLSALGCMFKSISKYFKIIV